MLPFSPGAPGIPGFPERPGSPLGPMRRENVNVKIQSLVYILHIILPKNKPEKYSNRIGLF